MLKTNTKDGLLDRRNKKRFFSVHIFSIRVESVKFFAWISACIPHAISSRGRFLADLFEANSANKGG